MRTAVRRRAPVRANGLNPFAQSSLRIRVILFVNYFTYQN
jgi:hypothetical protein